MQYLVIEGNIGAGKTTLTKMLADDLNARIVLEQFADNPFLPKFYNDPQRFSFPLELSFLAERYKQLNAELRASSLFQPLLIADYFFMKSLIFAQNTLAKDEFNLYRQIFEIIYSSIPKPDLYVYLHVPVDRLISNIKKRGRDYEQSITPEYLETIQQGYFEFFKQHPDYSFLIIDTSELDFVDNQDDYLLIRSAIFDKSHKKGVQRLSF
ncbi:deoxynucleoside kinase [Perlabentimonas gracilis]|jgi:deoxyadenosine/deoxycytidine kinase|uniref:deoxynucleoside kinase n=1 Tax=Perlabentimonas gracilis TaxID=2715279 RepID=UPI001409FF56|nr:deoxynucleoside kinase [Perlabentimonas gracilis]NHB67358.1 deoxynucleoside kinase [Perlabentimonas gracilis]